MSSSKKTQQSKQDFLRKIGVVIWVSFVAASVATMLFFATFDPLLINDAATYPMTLSRTSSYSVGFFLFWMLTASTGAMVAWLSTLPEKPNTKPKTRKRSKN